PTHSKSQFHVGGLWVGQPLFAESCFASARTNSRRSTGSSVGMRRRQRFFRRLLAERRRSVAESRPNSVPPRASCQCSVDGTKNNQTNSESYWSERRDSNS